MLWHSFYIALGDGVKMEKKEKKKKPEYAIETKKGKMAEFVGMLGRN